MALPISPSLTERLIILDRDGVINQDSDAYVKSLAEWQPIPGSLEAIARLSQSGWTVAVATNQSGLARGLFNAETLAHMHQLLQTQVAALGGRIDLILHCPHGPDDNCACRKPRPGMFQHIAAHYQRADLQGVPVVGDSLRDLQAGLELGATPYLVRTGKGLRTLAKGPLPPSTQVFANLAELTDHLIGAA